jgi:hypothetical protein
VAHLAPHAGGRCGNVDVGTKDACPALNVVKIDQVITSKFDQMDQKFNKMDQKFNKNGSKV